MISLNGIDYEEIGRGFHARFWLESVLLHTEIDAPHAARISAFLAGAVGQGWNWVVESFEVTRLDGEASITTESLRLMAVGNALRRALEKTPHVVLDPDGNDYRDAQGSRTARLRARREAGPVTENLEELASTYLAARLLHENPVGWVALEFDLPPRTATHWVKLARERGHLHG